MSNCHCGSGRSFEECCEPIINGDQLAPTAEAMMRARYSAYVVGNAKFLGESLHPAHRQDWDEAATRRWSEHSEWLGLEVRGIEAGQKGDQEGLVEFVALYKEDGLPRKHHEISRFKKEGKQWYYVDGEMPKPETQRNEGPKVGRNDPCPCGSGKKYKKCCGR
ncbi:MAG: YchJ family protein [bacterium]